MKVDDTLSGTANQDRIFSGVGNDLIKAGQQDDAIYGEAGNDRLYGSSGNDNLSGGSGNDRLHGGWGLDILRGGSGQDVFVFSAGPNGTTNVDSIRDFSVVNDLVWLENRVFTALGSAGRLKASAFWTGNEAHDANDRIIYDRDDGVLYYDQDGTGAGAQVAFAKLSTGLRMTYLDFQVI